MENSDNESIDLQTIKYLIHIKFVIAGIAEKSDIIGAIFGQTEGLLGDSMDLRELQKTSRIGRIVVKIQYDKAKRKTLGVVILPSSLDRVETSILAASLETVDRVGPCLAKIQLSKVEDVRSTKRQQIVSRATQILQTWDTEVAPESQNLVEEVVKQARMSAISKWGPEGLPAGPGVDESDTIILVEGRADVLNLLRYGFRNVVAVQGTHIPESILPLTKRKRTIVFLDGDRGGDLILRELLELADIDFVARAPPGREVEELTGKEVLKTLRNKIPIEQVLKELETKIEGDKEGDHERLHIRERDKERGSKKIKGKGVEIEESQADIALEYQRSESANISQLEGNSGSDLDVTIENAEAEELIDESDFNIGSSSSAELPPEILALAKSLGSFEALLVASDNSIIKKIPVKDLRDTLTELNPQEPPQVKGIVFDGIITQRLLDLVTEKQLTFVAGAKLAEMVTVPVNIKLFELSAAS